MINKENYITIILTTYIMDKTITVIVHTPLTFDSSGKYLHAYTCTNYQSRSNAHKGVSQKKPNGYTYVHTFGDFTESFVANS